MELDKGGAGCAAALAVAFILILAAILITTNIGGLMDGANRSETQRLQAQADVYRAQAQIDQVHAEHRETMFMLWSATVAAFTAGPGVLNLFGLLTIGLFALFAGYTYGLRRR